MDSLGAPARLRRGFTWSGIKLASDAKNSQSGRDQHRRVSYISMGAALAGYAVMLIGDH